MARLWWLRFTTRATWIITVCIICKKINKRTDLKKMFEYFELWKHKRKKKGKSWRVWRKSYVYEGGNNEHFFLVNRKMGVDYEYVCEDSKIIISFRTYILSFLLLPLCFFVCSRKIYIHNAFVSCITFDPFLFITSLTARTFHKAVRTENAIVDRTRRIYNDIGVGLLCSCILFI